MTDVIFERASGEGAPSLLSLSADCLCVRTHPAEGRSSKGLVALLAIIILCLALFSFLTPALFDGDATGEL